MRRWLALMALLLPAPGALAAEHLVTMQGHEYSPSEMSTKQGDVIRFVNDDSADHNVFVPTVGFGVDFGRQEPGSEVVLPLQKTGTFEVECVLHAHMLLTVTVAE